LTALACCAAASCQEAAGIVAYDGEQFSAHRGPGLVSDNFSSKEVIDRTARKRRDRARSLCNHRRGGSAQHPALFADFEFGGLAICHNGNLTNSYKLRQQLVPARQPVSVDKRYRSHRSPDRNEPQRLGRRPPYRCVASS